MAVSLAGCASAPPGSGSPTSASGVVRAGPAPPSERDGPDANPPSGLAGTPDAEPRDEPVRAGGPNKPYEALGVSYAPFTDERRYVERGLASWYGKKFQGRRTSSGEPYDMYAMTAAHPTLPIPSYVRVRNPANGREVVVRINDRGPFHPGRIIDLSYTAALKLDVLRGVTPVELERITPEDIRTGAWQRGERVALQAQRGAAAQAAQAATPAAPPQLAPAAGAPAAASTATGTAVAATTTAIAATSATTAAAAAAPVAPSVAAALTPLAPLPGAEARDVSTAAQAPTTPAAPGPSAALSSTRGFWVQIGAFSERSGAETFQRRVASELGWLAPLLAIFDEQKMHRLQAGPYPDRGEAGSALRRIGEALQLKPLIVERR